MLTTTERDFLRTMNGHYATEMTHGPYSVWNDNGGRYSTPRYFVPLISQERIIAGRYIPTDTAMGIAPPIGFRWNYRDGLLQPVGNRATAGEISAWLAGAEYNRQFTLRQGEQNGI